MRQVAWLAVAGLVIFRPAYAQDEAFKAMEEVFNSRTTLATRLQLQNAMIAGGYFNAVPTERFSFRLFNGIKRLQADVGVSQTGIADTASVERVQSIARQQYGFWDLRRVRHPVRDRSILMPTGMGLTVVPNDRGIAYSDVNGRVLARFNHFPNTSAADNYRELVSKYEKTGVKIHYKVYKDGWFVLSTTSSAGTDGYLRYHDDDGGITGFALFWNNDKGNVAGERIAILMSASLLSQMTGTPFVDPPIAPESQVASLPPPSAALPPRESNPAPRPQNVSSGTGFFISNDGALVTNAHVIRGCSTIVVRASNQVTYTARVVARDEVNDLALLRSDARPLRSAVVRGFARLGEDVAAFGFPHSDTFASSGNFTLGNITATSGLGDDSRYYQVSAAVHGGNSGGPLLDERGNVVGVVTAKLDALKFAAKSGDIPQNVNFALKAGLLTVFLDGNGVRPNQPAADAPKLDRPDLAEIAREISGFVMCR